jgi:hypothetical protein
VRERLLVTMWQPLDARLLTIPTRELAPGEGSAKLKGGGLSALILSRQRAWRS